MSESHSHGKNTGTNPTVIRYLVANDGNGVYYEQGVPVIPVAEKKVKMAR